MNRRTLVLMALALVTLGVGAARSQNAAGNGDGVPDIFHPPAPDPVGDLPETVTFSEHVAPIVFNNCTPCHRAGQVTPFTFMNYDEVRKRGPLMAAVAETRYMPPWKPVPGHGDLADSMRLTDGEIALLRKWVDDGMPQGDPAATPPLPEFTEGWELGEPDLIVAMPAPYTVTAEGPDVYRSFIVPVDLPTDKWVRALEVKPSSLSAMHHVIVNADPSGFARVLDGIDGEPGFASMGGGALRDPDIQEQLRERIGARVRERIQQGLRGEPRRSEFKDEGFGGVGGLGNSLGAWVPGSGAFALPEGSAHLLPAGSDLVLNSHFLPSGRAETEQTLVGLYFDDRAPDRSVVSMPLWNFAIDIPPGESEYVRYAEFTAPVDVDLIGIWPHAHLLARDIKGWVEYPDGTAEPLIWIDDWDFNWQMSYLYEEAIRLPAGSKVVTRIVYDNSADNPRNPNTPPARVTFGEKTTDEMMLIPITLLPANEADVDILRASVKEQQNAQIGDLFRGGSERDRRRPGRRR